MAASTVETHVLPQTTRDLLVLPNPHLVYILAHGGHQTLRTLKIIYTVSLQIKHATVLRS